MAVSTSGFELIRTANDQRDNCNGPAGRNDPCDPNAARCPAGRSMLVHYAAGTHLLKELIISKRVVPFLAPVTCAFLVVGSIVADEKDARRGDSRQITKMFFDAALA